MMVKICGITNRDDAMAAIDGGAAALGFNFYPKSPRYVAPERAAELTRDLPAIVWRVGVFVREAPDRVLEIARLARLDVAQLHGGGDAPGGLRIWRACHVDGSFDPASLDAEAEAFLLDAPFDGTYGGTGRTFDWRRAAGAARKIIVAGGLDETNVRAAIQQARPWGVDACSRLERAPGQKDRAKLTAFLKAALEEIE